ncbi:MAG: sensor histidine kinase, partial [Devosia sp.]|nr:sensor histidine kinase [Devosia sp.]
MAAAGNGHRPEVLRRKTLANNSRLLILLSALAMPFAIYLLVTGSLLPFVIAALALTVGMVTLSLHQRQLFDLAAAGLVYAMLAIGCVLTLVDPRLGDAGLAIAVMGPILAALAGRTPLRRQSWAMLGGVIALAGLASLLPPLVISEAVLMATNVAAFCVATAVVLHTANRINAAYEVYDKSQMAAYRHLIEHVQDGVIRFSSDGDILLASRSSEQLFGCRRYELSTSTLSDRIHILDRPAYLSAFAEANQGGRTRTFEVRMRQDDARGARNVPRFIWVEISLSPVVDPDRVEQRHEVVALFHDVTS